MVTHQNTNNNAQLNKRKELSSEKPNVGSDLFDRELE